MPNPIQFRRPHITFRQSPTFGIPRGTFGRGEFDAPEAIILHALRVSLETYDAQETNISSQRNRAVPRHPSLHYAINYEGAVHQYVNDADTAWGMWDYDTGDFPDPFPEGDWDKLTEHDGVTPDLYCLHIGMMSGEYAGEPWRSMSVVPMTRNAILTHARLIAWLCHTYEIDCDTDHVIKHETADTQFVDDCIGDSTYPYAEILAAAQEIIANGGETDIAFEGPMFYEYVGAFTIGISRVGSMAFIRYP